MLRGHIFVFIYPQPGAAAVFESICFSSPADIHPPFKSNPFAWLHSFGVTRLVPSNQTLSVFPCCRSSLSRGRSIFLKPPLRRWRADAPAATAGNVKRLERGGVVGVGLLMAAWIHFLILEHFLDLSGVCGDSWAHGLSCSQSERRLCFPSL